MQFDNKINILLLDNDPFFSRVFLEYLEAHHPLDAQAFESYNAFKDNCTIQPDLIFLDYYFDEEINQQPGLMLIPQIKAELPDAEVVVLSPVNKLDNAMNAIASGADDFIEKKFSSLDRLIILLQKARVKKLTLRSQFSIN